MNAVASCALAPHFQDQAPEYPIFLDYYTKDSRRQAVQDALRWIASTSKTQQGAKVLDALELLRGDRLDPGRSKYARQLLAELRKKGSGQVLNRAELIETVQGVEYVAPDKYRLEPSWVVVLLSALVHSGDLVVAIPGKKFDATGLEELASTSIDDLVNFKHLERPKDWNVPGMKALFELLGLSPGGARLVTLGQDEPVERLQERIEGTVNALVESHHGLQSGINFWDGTVLEGSDAEKLGRKMDGTQGFLESLRVFNTPGKFKNFTYGSAQVRRYGAGLEALASVRALTELIRGDPGSSSAYLAMAMDALPDDHEWTEAAKGIREELLKQIRKPANWVKPAFRRQASQMVGDLKERYVREYLRLHGQARLGPRDDERKKRLLRDDRLTRLKTLATIDLMPQQQLADLQNRLAGIQSCFALTKQELGVTPKCPRCRFRSATEEVLAPVGTLLSALDIEMDVLVARWTKVLLANLDDPTIREQLSLLKADQRSLVDPFIASRTLPDDLSDDFIQALWEILSGLSKVVVTPGDLREALTSGGSPATIDEMRKRFEGYLDDRTKGMDRAKVRIVLEEV